MVPFDVVTSRDHMASQSGRVTIFCESLKMFNVIVVSFKPT